MISGILALLKSVFKVFDFALGLVAFIWVPVVVSFIFCLLTGIPFMHFWHVVFTVLSQCIGELLSYCNMEGFHKMQHWFRYMIF